MLGEVFWIYYIYIFHATACTAALLIKINENSRIVVASFSTKIVYMCSQGQQK